MGTMLDIQGLTKQFGQFTAVDDVSFSVAAGEVLGFLGPNGSGKSTTMKMVTGFLTPTAGTAIVCGNDVTRDPIAVKRHEVFNQQIGTLSKGFKRRVGLAQAILHDPDVLILDEPTDGLDPNQKHHVRELIADMSKDKVIVISTHVLEEVDAVCSQAIVIARGKRPWRYRPCTGDGQERRHDH